VAATRIPDFVAVFSRAGTLAVSSGQARYLMPRAGSVTGVVMSVNTAPTGASVICDLNKNGSTMFSTQANRPTISAAAFKTSSSATPNTKSFAAGDYLTVDVDQVGSTIPGADLVVVVSYRAT